MKMLQKMEKKMAVEERLKVEIKTRKVIAGGCACMKVEVAENTGD